MSINRVNVRAGWFGCIGGIVALTLSASTVAQQLLPSLGTFDAMGDVGAQGFQADGA